MKTGGFFKSNWTYFLWAIFYIIIATVLLGCSIESFILTTCLYAISITIALSPLGEILLKYIEGARPIITKEEKEYLEPIWKEVKQNAIKENHSLANVELFIIDAMFVNAFAMGSQTITITRGMIDILTDEQLKGVLGHELGHIANGDTKALLLNVVGNGIFSIAVVCIRLILIVIEALAEMVDKTGTSKLLISFMNFTLNVCTFLFLQIGQIILALNSRKNEYFADEFSFRLGYGEQLIEVLYILQRMDMGGKLSLINRLKASHPYLPERISRLESII